MCQPAGTGTKQQKSSQPKPHFQGWLTGNEDEIEHRAPAVDQENQCKKDAKDNVGYGGEHGIRP